VLAVLTLLTSCTFAVVDLGFTNALIQSGATPARHTLLQVQWYKLAAGATGTLALALSTGLLASHYNLPTSYSLLFPACGLVAWLPSEP